MRQNVDYLARAFHASARRRHRQSVYLSVGRWCQRLSDIERVYDSRGQDPRSAGTGMFGWWSSKNIRRIIGNLARYSCVSDDTLPITGHLLRLPRTQYHGRSVLPSERAVATAGVTRLGHVC
jgi:hypothetical protein